MYCGIYAMCYMCQLSGERFRLLLRLPYDVSDLLSHLHCLQYEHITNANKFAVVKRISI